MEGRTATCGWFWIAVDTAQFSLTMILAALIEMKYS